MIPFWPELLGNLAFYGLTGLITAGLLWKRARANRLRRNRVVVRQSNVRLLP